LDQLPTGTPVNANALRSLETFLNGWLDPISGPSGLLAYNEAIIIGFQVTIGSGESDVTAFVKDYRLSTPRPNPIYDWTWEFTTA
jgi:hypothetical protein